ncbi:MAG: hypothetical protein QM766_13430 [Burkholderiaceae bacterium]
MSKSIIAAMAVAVVAVAALPAPAHAWHGRVGVGVYMGGPIYGPGYYGPYPYYWGGPYYYPPAVVTVPVPTTPPVYVEQTPQSAAPVPANPSGYWYYCAKPAGYYPTVKECSSAWQRVAPLPAQ